MRKRFVSSFAPIVGFLTIMSGCGTVVTSGDNETALDMENTFGSEDSVESGESVASEASVPSEESVIAEAIVAINQNPAKWADALEKVARQLPEGGSGKVREKVSRLVDRNVPKTDTPFQCPGEILRGRAVQGLQEIKNMIDGIPASSPLPPAICAVSPSEIDLSRDPATWEPVTIHGYDLDQRDGKGNSLTFTLVDQNQSVIQSVPEHLIQRKSHAQISLNLRELAETLHTQKIVRVAPDWSSYLDGSARGGVPVKPWNPRKKIMTVELGQTTFVPPHLSGDRDFHTGRKDPTYGFVSAEIEVDDRTIKGRVRMNARQKKGDHTHAEGEENYILWEELPENLKITRVGPRRSSKRPFIITKRGPNTFTQPKGQIVKSFKVYGARQWDKANRYTKVEVDWSPLSIEVVETQPSWYPSGQEQSNGMPVRGSLPAKDLPSTEEVIVIENTPLEKEPVEEDEESFIIPSKHEQSGNVVSKEPNSMASQDVPDEEAAAIEQTTPMAQDAPSKNEPVEEGPGGFLIPLPGE